jgi:hypothetical protein
MTGVLRFLIIIAMRSVNLDRAFVQVGRRKKIDSTTSYFNILILITIDSNPPDIDSWFNSEITFRSTPHLLRGGLCF